ncbi:hypothetical protein [Streptomyces sp. NRRL F-2799]|uniref:hypothetical protein n=1 Tax=Streptomyces sp. NRRL F-2799 TaxID=1463844 RepID=UPI00131A566F
MSISPSLRIPGAKPSTGAASPATRTTRARSPKIVERMILLVPSRSPTGILRDD